MKIYYADTGRDEFVFIRWEPSLLMIVGWDNLGSDKYDFKDSSFIFFKNQELATELKNVTEITDIFWNYVLSDQKRWLKQKLTKTIFESS